jgi:hypothetical protein
LRRKTSSLTSWREVTDSRGDREGKVTYTGSDGSTYRVNADAENGRRFLEKLVNRRWEMVDINKLPGKSQNERILERIDQTYQGYGTPYPY